MKFFLQCIFCFAFSFLVCAFSFAANENGVEGFSHDEVMKLGQRMYRDGILPSGEPMQAIVMGDIPVDGRAFTCDDCHQRSGLGSNEGTVITWPINGKYLAEPRRRTGAWRPPEKKKDRVSGRGDLPPQYQIDDVRPAYTDETLARAIIEGEDALGNAIDPIMPLYLLDDKNLAVLIYYLKNLYLDLSPGVDETTIRFATVVTEEVPLEKRTAMMSALQAHIDARNSQSRHEERRSKSGPFYKTEMYQAYRRLELIVWDLKGSPETWPSQLEKYYKTQPVFGFLGGISTGSWAPMHEFCEEHGLPSLFPVTDLPVVSDTDWFTLYFSKGLYQEGEAVAKYLYANKIDFDGESIVQIYRKRDRNAALAKGFQDTWKEFGRPAVIDLIIEEGQKLTPQIYKDILESHKPSAVLLWLDKEDLSAMGPLTGGTTSPEMFFSSWSLLEEDGTIFTNEIREKVYLTYPYIFPGESGKRQNVVRGWLRARKIPVTDLEIQSKMYFLGWMLSGGIKGMRSDFYREHFLEGFDMMLDQDYAIAVYPRVSFGPGQRYASKGCYIVQLNGGLDSELVKRSDWIVY